MRIDFAGTCPKDLLDADSNEDAFCISLDGSRVAICDGASESYDSRCWAEILAKKFAADPKFGVEWLGDALRSYTAMHDRQAMSWSQRLGYDRGSFATLIGVDHDPAHRAVDVLAIGDCIALLLDGDRFVKSWAIDDPDRFKDHPTLLSTLAAHNIFVSEADFCQRSIATIHLDRYAEPRLLCMSDALGDWALREALAGTGGLARLASLADLEALRELVVSERAAKRMRIDDSTLINISFCDSPIGDALPIS